MLDVWSAEVSPLVVTLYTMRQAFASEILTISLHCVWRVEPSRHLRVSINESIVGESARTIPLTCSFMIRFSATNSAETAMDERFQFGSVSFFQCPAFASPECYIDNNRLMESATGVDRYHFLVAE
jgi:hypothetical protein